jgi:predicted DNA-binding helix-hairpin-helix protein
MTTLDAALAGKLNEQQREALYRRLWAPLNLNTASKQEILLIPGVGDRMLHEFEEYRPYPALARFHREIAKYVDDAELARLAQYVFVPIDLNSASDEDIMTIPGMGPRMLHEFKEYRPYNNMEQFRREIGKYVDEKEVARLQHYVTIRQ